MINGVFLNPSLSVPTSPLIRIWLPAPTATPIQDIAPSSSVPLSTDMALTPTAILITEMDYHSYCPPYKEMAPCSYRPYIRTWFPAPAANISISTRSPITSASIHSQ